MRLSDFAEGTTVRKPASASDPRCGRVAVYVEDGLTHYGVQWFGIIQPDGSIQPFGTGACVEFPADWEFEAVYATP